MANQDKKPKIKKLKHSKEDVINAYQQGMIDTAKRFVTTPEMETKAEEYYNKTHNKN